MKTAIVYDWIDKWGGVERLLLTLQELYPKADFYTSYVDLKTAPWAKNLYIVPSFIQRLPQFIKKNRLLSFILYPYAFESFNFSNYDMVISVSSSFAKSVITKPDTKHVSILLTPTRYIWLYPEHYLKSSIRRFFGGYISSLKQWDRIAARRSDVVLSISQEVQSRCQQYYDLKSEIVYPPFDVDYWSGIKSSTALKKSLPDNDTYYLVVSRLEPYKRIDLVVDTFNQTPQKKLIIVGEGSLLNVFRHKGKSNITFMRHITDEALGVLYMHAQALIMPQVEDFGYTALEAQYFGTPVVAYDRGGVAETVINGKTGLFFNKQTILSLQSALERFDRISYNLKRSTKLQGPIQATKFNKRIFGEKINKTVTNLYSGRL